MSTDSDDVDEDELLQMALKEQSQRNVNYRSKASKPVVNMVRPPPPPQFLKETGAASKNPSSAANARRGAAEEDDDSEVELLSISSGDEDSSKDPRYAAKGRPAAAARRGGRSDSGDGAWQGVEPDCWKRVDETEVFGCFDLGIEWWWIRFLLADPWFFFPLFVFDFVFEFVLLQTAGPVFFLFPLPSERDDRCG